MMPPLFKDNGTDMSDIESARKRKAVVTTVCDLGKYEGKTIEEKVDDFIATTPVAMINRSWCLFSVDAIEFLVKQLGVSVHSIQADLHPEGKAILKYLTERTRHKTTPIIFINGEYVGGFEDINNLYSLGQLQEDLKNVSQADRCELEIADNDFAKKPLFWFPKELNSHSVRITGVLTSFVAAASAGIFWCDEYASYIAYFLLLDFFLRIMGGAKIAPMGRLGCFISSRWEPKMRTGRAKQFAACCGFLFAFLGSLFYSIPFYWSKYVGALFMLGLAIATAMEGFLDYCLGCLFFRIGVKLGIF